MSNPAAILVAASAGTAADDEARSVVVDAGSEPGDPHFVSLVVAAKANIRNGLTRPENLQKTINNLNRSRIILQVEAESQAKELRRTMLRMGKRRGRIENLELRVRNLGPEDQDFRTAVEAGSYMYIKEDLEERVRVEKEGMMRDVEFAQRILEKISDELIGL